MIGRQLFVRMMSIIPTLFGALTLIFFIVHLIPGDPVAVMLGSNYSPAAYEATRHQLGLDRPLLTQYTTYLGRIFTGNFGDSFRTKQPIVTGIVDQFPFTMQLAIGALLISMVIGIPAGAIAATHRNRLPDQLSMVVALIGICTPAFWLGVVLIYVFSVKLDLLPSIGAAGFDQPGKMVQSLILPCVTLGAVEAAILARITRASLLEVLSQDYVRTARAKGLSGRAVLFRHALRNALIPVITVLTLELGQLLAGSAIVEIVFSRPGVGHLLIDAVLARDYPQVQATLLFFVVLISLATLLGDLLYGFIDPRIHYA